MNQPYDIFFTGSTNPRECIMIGGIRGTEDAIYLEFRTPNIPAAETQTTVLRNGQTLVATFEWTMSFHLGMATVGTRRIHMSELVQPGIHSKWSIDCPAVAPGCRVFQTADGQVFHWRRLNTLNGYDLYHLGPNQEEVNVVAHFRNEMTNSPIGPCHAHMQSWWIDWQGM